ncbi:MAG: formylmethanofuran dehydrogenase [Anaerolineales bacterium]|nr:formylmethanofuran dehydrogenase [Anaerolineae bacterium]PWB69610.1 MAG: formylmethanofuran dehydrogenase [Anaerolineales bacterium]
MWSLESILQESASRHRHLCPRQVLGARMALFASELFALDLPRMDKRLLVISETDGCTVDGLVAASGCHVGGRTLRILDFGKVAATFVDIDTETAIRIRPRREARSLARTYVPTAKNKWEAMLRGYQIMPYSELFEYQHVRLNGPVSALLSRPSAKAVCGSCGEEIINGREVMRAGEVLCRPCAGDGYYHSPLYSSVAMTPQSMSIK